MFVSRRALEDAVECSIVADARLLIYFKHQSVFQLLRADLL